ncbi:hypothetical protein SS50377_27797 [Spironucleus salmonicida]|uniref:Uncharacterized protein n=1 Tax=Spironucleus salmonicida TaxID=348837 RepID=V6LXB1_9EUKA|nr:hypothetical protein SS50377_27797 [Spironucleus salmonicida]|eukprot:EST48888.1 Hypothetical protein SS50377_11001 [Spironucleus salmonicida]
MNRQAVIKDQESKPTYKEAIPVLQKQDTVEQYSKEVIKNIDSSKVNFSQANYNNINHLYQSLKRIVIIRNLGIIVKYQQRDIFRQNQQIEYCMTWSNELQRYQSTVLMVRNRVTSDYTTR